MHIGKDHSARHHLPIIGAQDLFREAIPLRLIAQLGQSFLQDVAAFWARVNWRRAIDPGFARTLRIALEPTARSAMPLGESFSIQEALTRRRRRSASTSRQSSVTPLQSIKVSSKSKRTAFSRGATVTSASASGGAFGFAFQRFAAALLALGFVFIPGGGPIRGRWRGGLIWCGRWRRRGFGYR